MKIERILNPDISLYLIPWYVEDGKTSIEIGMELNDRMRDNPNDTCVLIVTKNGQMKAFLAGYINNDSAFIWQGRKSKDMDKPRLVFHIFCRWARERGANKVQLMSSNRRLRRMYRRKYGFTQVGDYLMEKSLWESAEVQAVNSNSRSLRHKNSGCQKPLKSMAHK